MITKLANELTEQHNNQYLRNSGIGAGLGAAAGIVGSSIAGAGDALKHEFIMPRHYYKNYKNMAWNSEKTLGKALLDDKIKNKKNWRDIYVSTLKSSKADNAPDEILKRIKRNFKYDIFPKVNKDIKTLKDMATISLDDFLKKRPDLHENPFLTKGSTFDKIKRSFSLTKLNPNTRLASALALGGAGLGTGYTYLKNRNNQQPQ